MWDKLSMADKAKIIKLGVDSGITYLDDIRATYNKFAEGGRITEEEQGPEGPEIGLGEITGAGINLTKHDLKDMAYAAMAGQRHFAKKKWGESWTTTAGASRSVPDIIYSLANIDEILQERGEQPRDLASLYIYGNDKGQFQEDESLRDKGTDLSARISQSGRNPNKTKVYRGIMPARQEEITFPNISREPIINAILSNNVQDYGAMAADDWEGDDVARYAQKLDLDSRGNPILVKTDYWDFGPEYKKSYKYNMADIQAYALDKVGTPFLLKDAHPLQFVDDDTFFDQWENNWDVLPDVVKGSLNDAGILRPIIVEGVGSGNKRKKKK